MCTATWLINKDSYEVFFNRDEKRARKQAIPPVISSIKGTRVVAPRDGDFGGTWLGVNNHGITVGMLNNYLAPPSRFGASTSRGHLVTDLLSRSSPADIKRKLSVDYMGQFRPCIVVVLSFQKGFECYIWDGKSVIIKDNSQDILPLTSSSFETVSVEESRKIVFNDMLSEAGGLTPVMLNSFHRSHQPKRGASSVCMHRSEARTVSFSRISVHRGYVTPGKALFQYCAASPCIESTAMVTEISLKPSLAK